MKCLLHIGTEKTGTTILQDWLYSNIDELSSQKVYLSKSLGVTNNRLFPSYFQTKFDDWYRSNKISTDEEKNLFFSGFLERLSQEVKLASEKHDLFLVTSEHLHSRVTNTQEINAIKEFLTENFDSVSVVCYFRPQSDMAVSLYSTALKVAYSSSLEEFLNNQLKADNYYYDFKKIADNWSGAFGKKNCFFRIYNKKHFLDGDIRKDFLSCLPVKVEPEKLNYTIKSSNESLKGLTAVAFSLINRLVPYWDAGGSGVNPVNLKLKEIVNSLSTMRVGVINTAQISELNGIFDKSNKDLLKEYFGQEDKLTLQSSSACEVEQSFSYEEVVKIVEDIFECMLPLLSSKELSNLTDNDADKLRDMAINIEKNEQLNLKHSLYLMKLAQRVRPDGQLINRKIAEYQSKL